MHERCEWEAHRLRRQAELEDCRRRLDARAALERELTGRCRQWEERLQELQAEAAGLDARIEHQRRALHEQEKDLNWLEGARHRLKGPPAPAAPLIVFIPKEAARKLEARERELRQAEAEVM